MRRLNSRLFTQLLLPGMVLAMLIMASSGAILDKGPATFLASTDQEEESPPPEIQDFRAVVPLAKLVVSHDLYLIFELTLLVEFDFEDVHGQPDSNWDSYLRTLLRRIISINAP